jgi:hypothetical protein
MTNEISTSQFNHQNVNTNIVNNIKNVNTINSVNTSHSNDTNNKMNVNIPENFNANSLNTFNKQQP